MSISTPAPRAKRKLTYRVPGTSERYSANTVAGAKVAVEAAKVAGTTDQVPDRIKRIATAVPIAS